jgi:hypothetical protein
MPASLQRDWGNRDVALVRTDAYLLPRADAVAWNHSGPLSSLADYAGVENDRGYLRLTLDVGNADEIVGRMDDERLAYTQAGPWLVLIGNDKQAVDEHLSRVSSLMPEPRPLSVTLTLRRGSQAAPLARAVACVRAGARSTILFGRESTFVHSSRSEVAQGAMAVAARLSASFEGLAVALDPRTTSSGGLFVAVDAHARVAHGPMRTFDAGTGVPAVGQQDADLLNVKRYITFDEDDARPRRIVLGNSGSEPGALMLEIEIADAR